jgi:flagellar protein FlaG
MKAIEAPTVTAASTGTSVNASATAGAKVADDSRTAAAVEKSTPRSPQEMNAAVRVAAAQIDSYLKRMGRELTFRVDDETGMTVVTVLETATGDVIRQIPSEEVLRLAQHLAAGNSSLLDLTV